MNVYADHRYLKSSSLKKVIKKDYSSIDTVNIFDYYNHINNEQEEW